ncbi:MAG: VWA domain-containing protein [Verrucomicrobiae bacterium]|nr:VWA domain-containing protein [Verrucomicrobiae bacterium]
MRAYPDRSGANPQHRRFFIAAILLSVLLHIVVYLATSDRRIGMRGYFDELLTQHFKVQRVDMEPASTPKPLDRERLNARIAGPAPATAMSAQPALPEMPKAPEMTPPTEAKTPSVSPPAPVAGGSLPQAQPELSPADVVAMQSKNLKDTFTVETGKRGTAPGGNSAGTPGAGETGPGFPQTGGGRGEPSGLPGPASGGALPEPGGQPSFADGAHTLRDLPPDRPYQQIAPWMNIDLYTYEEKGEGYFMLKITAKENNILKVVPKDVFFAIDSSSSIGQSRLFQFKSAVDRSLRDLNPKDRFNLLFFQTLARTYRKGGFVPYSMNEATKVDEFMKDADSEGRTDVFRAILPLTQLPRQSDRMRMGFLLSDGRPNEGEKSSARIINEFTAQNHRGTSLFTLAGGQRLNPFLLEFLSYQNQGLSVEVPDEAEISTQFFKFYRAVKDPLLLDLDFKFAGVDPAQVYPRNLPHIYQNTPLLIYGRYDPSHEKLFTMQILGNSFGTTKELLTRQVFSEAKKGTRQIALDWGKQKTYHLIGQTLQGASPELDAEIRRTSQRYEVDIRDLYP